MIHTSKNSSEDLANELKSKMAEIKTQLPIDMLSNN